jgi:hypothetical protein
LSIITLITDFGIKDGNVGVMKGVIWGIAPRAQIADLSHMISPQDIAEGSLILSRSAPYFPPGTVHLAVVDPGVGTTRRPIAARLGEQYFVGPDNGLLTRLLERVEREALPTEFYHLNRPQYWLAEVSHVFHGRDIFAPVAAHLANGMPLPQLGVQVGDPLRLALSQPQRTGFGWQGQIIHIDHFGNIASNILAEHLGRPARLTVRLGDVEITGMVDTFGERPPGELVVLYGSTGNLLVCEVNGNAASRLGARVGDTIEAWLEG